MADNELTTPSAWLLWDEESTDGLALKNDMISAGTVIIREKTSVWLVTFTFYKQDQQLSLIYELSFNSLAPSRFKWNSI